MIALDSIDTASQEVLNRIHANSVSGSKYYDADEAKLTLTLAEVSDILHAYVNDYIAQSRFGVLSPNTMSEYATQYANSLGYSYNECYYVLYELYFGGTSGIGLNADTLTNTLNQKAVNYPQTSSEYAQNFLQSLEDFFKSFGQWILIVLIIIAVIVALSLIKDVV